MRKLIFVFIAGGVLALYGADSTAPGFVHNPKAKNGPANWGSAAATYATCGSAMSGSLVEVGMKQSPINIETGKVATQLLPPLQLQYNDTDFEVENTSHVIEVPYAAGGTLKFGQPGIGSPLAGYQSTDEYNLLQFHFHSPGEHQINGKLADAELHLVHQNKVGDLAVIGVMLNVGTDPNTVIDQIVGLAPSEEGSKHITGATLNAWQLLPAGRNYYTYSGSLTTPPCTEGVKWIVLKDAVNVSNFAIQQLRTLNTMMPGADGFNGNNRPVTPLHGRTILTRP